MAACLVLPVWTSIAEDNRAKVDAIDKLAAALGGSWSIQITLPESTSKPKGSDGHGEERFYRGPGGHSFIERYHSNGTEGKIIGLGIFWPNETGKEYRILWCDNKAAAGCIPMSGGGKWEGGDLVLRQHFEQDGKQVELKEVFSKITSDSFTQTLFEKQGDGEWKTTVIIEAIHAKSAKLVRETRPKK